MKLPKYQINESYDWNYQNAPEPVQKEIPQVAGTWDYCGLAVDSPLGIPAGPLLNGKWCLYYASLGFDILTYKTVRSDKHPCYALPNLVPVDATSLSGSELELSCSNSMKGSWAVSFGMPSAHPDVWRKDIEETKTKLPTGKLLSVSVVGTIQAGWGIHELAKDYEQCVRWAIDAGADAVETNFSCPNVSTCDGQLYQQTEDAKIVAQCVKETSKQKPYSVKIGYVHSVEQAKELLTSIGKYVDAIAMTNSIATQVRDQDTLLFHGEKRGICGDAIRSESVKQTRLFADLAKELDLPISFIGVGGVSHAEHVQEYLNAGASTVHLATAAMTDPEIAIKIKQSLSDYSRA
jgi:dihydroorotate dehydrogenase (NAD+) catalytic subunit